MSVVARMRVVGLHSRYAQGTEVELQPYMPTYDDPHAEEIKAFYDATPAGSFKATIKNALAAEQFQLGQEFYVRLEPVQP